MRPRSGALSWVRVPGAQVLLAGSGYVVLVLAGRSLPAPGLAVVSSFYLLVNTVGRGVFAASELELTRTVAQARVRGQSALPAARSVLLRTVGLVLAVWGVLAAGSPLLGPVVGGGRGLFALGFAATALAAGALVRGPLAARRQYAAYAATLIVEATAAIGAAMVLAVTGVDSSIVWMGVFGTTALLGALVAVGSRPGWTRHVVHASWRPEPAAPSDPDPATTSTPALVWSATLFLASQGLWNLGPVVVAGRLLGRPELVAGFASAAILLRAPTMVIPAIQTILLPRLVHGGEGLRGLVAGSRTRLVAGLLAAAAAWLVLAPVLTPIVVRWLFGPLPVPGPLLLGALALSVLLGAAASLLQARLLARSRHRAVGLAWAAGLAVMLAVAVLPDDPTVTAAVAQLVGSVIVIGALVGCERGGAA